MKSWPALPARRDPERGLPDRWDAERAVKRSDLDPIAAHLLLDLCTYMEPGTTVIPYRYGPSLTDLARDTGWTRRTVIRYLAELEKLGWLARIRPTPHNARVFHARTAYTVIIPEWLGTGDPQARASLSPGLGTDRHQAGDRPPPELGNVRQEARDPLAPNQTLSDQPDQSDEARLVIKLIEERTGVRVTAEWAADTVQSILSRPGIRNRRSYLIRTIVTDPNPQRWLPTAQPPHFHQEEQCPPN